ncbi:hypothetical protein OGATHE_006434 [Ogataea polymorpha]|uniref:Uncharacterized protein n=1 Tax=Ogataea polymorpha TaxID=460523 RepID=A0A9P8NRL7_9ASCO|nr:hypothetical protein OGATHE_006434 [Ogataea polymorpha]
MELVKFASLGMLMNNSVLVGPRDGFVWVEVMEIHASGRLSCNFGMGDGCGKTALVWERRLTSGSSKMPNGTGEISSSLIGVYCCRYTFSDGLNMALLAEYDRNLLVELIGGVVGTALETLAERIESRSTLSCGTWSEVLLAFGSWGTCKNVEPASCWSDQMLLWMDDDRIRDCAGWLRKFGSSYTALSPGLMLTLSEPVSGGISGVFAALADDTCPALDTSFVGSVPLRCLVRIPTLEAELTEHEFIGSSAGVPSRPCSNPRKLDRSIEADRCCAPAVFGSCGGVSSTLGFCWKSPNKGRPCCIGSV